MAVFPCAYFPSISYLKLLYEFQPCTIDLKENFVKQSIRNRCEILSANGRLKLIVPIQHNKLIKVSSGEIKIDYTDRWQTNHCRAIHSAYAHAPYFEDYFPAVKECIMEVHDLLCHKNMAILALFGELLDLQFGHHLADTYTKETKDDFRSYDFFLPEEGVKPYQQVFSYTKAFEENLSLLDLVFNEGPFARNWILTNQK